MQAPNYYEQPLPSDLMQNMMYDGIYASAFGKTDLTARRKVFINAEQNQSVTPTNGSNNKITIRIPRDGLGDMQTAVISFNLTITAPTVVGGDSSTTLSVFPQGGIAALFNRIRWYQSGNLDIEDVQNYNQIKLNVMDQNNTVQWNLGSGSIMEGRNIGPLACCPGNPGYQFWTQQGTSLFNQFLHSPMLGSFYSNQLWPFFALPTSYMDIYYEVPTVAFQAFIISGSGTSVNNNLQYTVSNVQLYYDCVYVNNAVMAEIDKVLTSPAGWQVHFPTFITVNSPNQTSTTIAQQFSVRAGSIKSVFMIGQPINWVNSLNYPSLKSTFYGLSQAQWKLNQQLYPQEPITSDQGLYYYMKEAFGSLNTMFCGGNVGDPHQTQPYNLDIIPGENSSGVLPNGGIQNSLKWGTYTYSQVCMPSYSFDLDHDETKITGVTTNLTATDIQFLAQFRTLGDTGGYNVLLVAFIDCIFTMQGVGGAAVGKLDK